MGVCINGGNPKSLTLKRRPLYTIHFGEPLGWKLPHDLFGGSGGTTATPNGHGASPAGGNGEGMDSDVLIQARYTLTYIYIYS